MMSQEMAIIRRYIGFEIKVNLAIIITIFSNFRLPRDIGC